MTEQEQDDATREGVQDSSRQERAPGVSARSRRVTGALVRFLRLFADMVTPTNVAVLAGLAVIGVTGILGGWKAIEEQPQDVPVVADGETVRTGPFDITVRQAMWAQDPGAFGLPDQGDALLVLRATVENTHGSWVDAYVLADALSGSLPGVDLVPQSGLFANSRATDGGIGTPTLRRAVDLQYASTVQPGLSQDYWFVWELPPDTQRTSHLDLTFHSQTWRASSLDGHHFWTDRVLIGHQEIVVDTDGEVS
ncbi:MAG: hypothetical protein ACTJGR_08135 [Pauljensenia sp.]